MMAESTLNRVMMFMLMNSDFLLSPEASLVGLRVLSLSLMILRKVIGRLFHQDGKRS
jgi:hypothetical protein